jgi:hypothetical protein
MKVYFNTGRLYTAEGQVITAEWDGKDSITFRDHSRGIDGVITTCKHIWDELHLAGAVMAAYDRGLYLYPTKEISIVRPDGEPKKILL